MNSINGLNVKLLVEAAAATGISSDDIAEAFRNISVSPVDTPAKDMTAEEALQFCRRREVEIFTSYDFITDAYIVRMRKGQAMNSVAISAMDIIEAKIFPLRSVLTRMADELDAMPPTAPEI